VPGGPDGLARVLTAVETTSLNIEYMYAFPFGHGDKAILVFRFEDLDAAIEQLQKAGISMLAREQLQEW
jgi:hypothetical protein